MPALLAPTHADLAAITPGDPADFVVLPDRIVWKEHWTRELRDEDGDVTRESVHIGRNELQKIVDRCNERILDTGDFATVCLGHTRDEKESGDTGPEVVGFAGPYHLVQFGRLRPKWAIAAKMWIFRADHERVAKFPRLSVEYWADEGDMTSGYFDPISLLGAETPELDLGIRYERNAAPGHRVIRYHRVERFSAEAATPGGNNTFIPGMAGKSDDGEKKKMLSVPYAKEGDEPDLTATQTTESEPVATLNQADLQQIVEAMIPVIQASVEDAMAAQKPAEAGDEDMPTTEGEMGDDMGEGSEVPADAGEAEPTDETRPDAEGDPGEDVQPEQFAKTGDEPDGDEGMAGAGDGDEDDQAMPPKAQVSKYRKERDDLAVKYRKERDAHAATAEKYAKLQNEVAGIRKEKVRAERYSKLSELLNQGYVLEVEDELADAEDMNETQFDRHVDRIVNKYSRVPLGSLPQDRPKKRKGGPVDQATVERYAKQAQDKVLAAQKAGQVLDYKTEFNNLMNGDGE